MLLFVYIFMLPQNTFILKIENLCENLFKAKHLQSGRNSVFLRFLTKWVHFNEIIFSLSIDKSVEDALQRT